MGCSVEANLIGEFEDGFIVTATQSEKVSIGTFGANELLINLIDVNGGSIILQISTPIIEENQQFIGLITADCSTFKIELI